LFRKYPFKSQIASHWGSLQRASSKLAILARRSRKYPVEPAWSPSSPSQHQRNEEPPIRQSPRCRCRLAVIDSPLLAAASDVLIRRRWAPTYYLSLGIKNRRLQQGCGYGLSIWQQVHAVIRPPLYAVGVFCDLRFTDRPLAYGVVFLRLGGGLGCFSPAIDNCID
jgi:hypothetical protein